MYCPSFSLPAVYSCPGSLQNENSPCSGCYSQMNMYMCDNVVIPQFLRFEWTKSCLKSQRGRIKWIDTMVDAIFRATPYKGDEVRYFRWHDSGDLFSPSYTRVVAEVIRLTPYVRHWIPTQSHRSKNNKIVGVIIKHILPLSNVVVRPSTDKINEQPEVWWVNKVWGSSVYLTEPDIPIGVLACPKSLKTQLNCRGCRVCWNSPSIAVGFLIHGIGGRNSLDKISLKMKEIRQGQMLKVLELLRV